MKHVVVFLARTLKQDNNNITHYDPIITTSATVNSCELYFSYFCLFFLDVLISIISVCVCVCLCIVFQCTQWTLQPLTQPGLCLVTALMQNIRDSLESFMTCHLKTDALEGMVGFYVGRMMCNNDDSNLESEEYVCNPRMTQQAFAAETKVDALWKECGMEGIFDGWCGPCRR